MNELILPESIQAEQVIISSLLHDKTGEVFDSCSKLKPSHFLTRSHYLIFESVLKLRAESRPSDLVTVGDDLQKSGKIQEIGGHGELARIFTSQGHLGIASDHIQIVLEKYRLRKLIDICEKAKFEASNGSESDECISKLEHELTDLIDNDDSNENQRDNACQDIERQIEVRRKNGDITGLLSGIKPFDDVFFGFQAGQLYILAGLPSSGKTAMADQACGNLLLRDESVLYISLESDRSRVMGKLACKIAGVPYWNFIRNRLQPGELDAVQKMVNVLKKKNLILMRPFDISPMELRPLIRKVKRRDNVSLVILDYLQKVNMPSGWDEIRTVARASTEMGRACVETGLPALVLCQLNREIGEGNRPSMRNLKGSSQIEQDADNVALIWSMTSKRDLPEGENYFPCILSVDKNKDGASGLDVEMDFEKRKMLFIKRRGI